MTALLTISDGTTEVDLLAPGEGFHLLRWIRNIVDFKGGGVFQDSPLAEGRRLVHASRANGIETFQLRANAINQNELLELEQDLFSLLQTAIDFWTGVTSTPVYISAKGNNEDNTRYAIIHNWRIPQLPSQFEAPFLQPGCLSALGEFDLILERGNWLGNIPGIGTAITLSTELEDYSYVQEWDTDTTATGEVKGFAEKASNSDLYAADEGDILKSSDDGATWAITDAVPTDCESILVASNGDIFGGDSGAIRVSTNDGGAWANSTTAPTTVINFLYETSDAVIWAGGNFELFSTGDFGATAWSTIPATLIPSGELEDMIELANGTYLILDTNRVWSSSDKGVTWSILATPYTTNGLKIIQLTSGDVLILAANNTVYRSTDNGVSWGIAFSNASGTGPASIPSGDLIQSPNGNLYVNTSAFAQGIGISFDNGFSWGAVNFSPSFEISGGLFGAANGYVYSGGDGNIFRRIPTTTDMATTATAVGFVANKWNLANITHVKRFDNGTGVYTDLFPFSGFPVDLYDTGHDAADITYFGIDAAVIDEGVFSNLIFDLLTPAVGLDLLWQYWDGGTWAALSTSDLTDELNLTGLLSLAWSLPSDWAKTAIDGITAFWIRGDVNAWSVAVANRVSPQQQNINIFSANTNFVEISAAQLGGDMPPLLRINVFNLSDAGSGLTLSSNRVIVGARSTSRGAFFVSCLNASDQQVNFGLEISAGTATAFTDSPQAITGRLATYNAAGVDSMATRLSWAIDAGVAQDYYGRYRIFLRGQQSGGSAGDISFRVRIVSGLGGVGHVGETITYPTTSAWSLADMGVFDIPATKQTTDNEITDSVTIVIQASSLNGTPNLLIHDIVLIPVDEWAGDFIDTVDSANSEIRNGYFLDIDSIKNPKINARSTLSAEAGFVSGIYQPVLSDKVIIPSTDGTVRFYFLNASLSSTNWFSNSAILSKVSMEITKRYYSGRGTN